ncbi:glycoside hydrolase family 76 protein [Marinilabilia salmonicolor]|uniref:glycoside hydrolase family 76 protein n=1 Tax=Marinilabilia salmonicolor TaxID=989 RepID=UPI000299F81B|nr:glycoside hydrolase family 76 protein [Marinilabilia salmonicolor]
MGNGKRKMVLGASLIMATSLLTGFNDGRESSQYLEKSEITLNRVLELYDGGFKHLFNETYPYQESNKATYLAGEDTLQGKRVAYLWPTSGIFSGVNALLRETHDSDYEEILNEIIVPGLENYYDDKREPACYQSYIVQAGESDRFYDDNIWLAIDFLEAFQLTNEQAYLDRSETLWKFILSGWDSQLGGGIYWCEQKKASKNTCSNAPAAVLAFKLFEVTQDDYYLDWGKKIYHWTKDNLQDPEDHLYFDNLALDGRIDRRKFTYNTGQMLQAAVMIYKITREACYLSEAEVIAESAINRFTESFSIPEGDDVRLFKGTDNWFNVIMFRGFEELYAVNNNPVYIDVFKDNLDYLWHHVRDENGLFSKSWAAGDDGNPKWLLDQASMIEFYASISKYY